RQRLPLLRFAAGARVPESRQRLQHLPAAAGVPGGAQRPPRRRANRRRQRGADLVEHHAADRPTIARGRRDLYLRRVVERLPMAVADAAYPRDDDAASWARCVAGLLQLGLPLDRRRRDDDRRSDSHLLHRRPALLRARARRRDPGRAAVVGISQSGESPDVVAVVAAARRQGAPTIAITNSPDSPLARAADATIDLAAGEERAVAATKTYTAELTAIALLALALGPEDAGAEAFLATLPSALPAPVEGDPAAERSAAARARIGGASVLWCGFACAPPRGWALERVGRVRRL